MKYRRDIDGLRSVAVLPVVLYHAGFPGFAGGFIGVDIFFVISGFLITTIVATEVAAGEFSLVSFYEKRARRILPALTCVILFTIAVGWFFMLPAELKDLGHSAIAASLFFSNVYFSLELDYFSPASEFVPLLHTWSLAVEEQFYLFFPPLLMFVVKIGWRQALLVIAGLSFLSLAAAVIVLPLKPDWVFFLIPFRAWELGVGAVLALVMCKPPGSRVARETLASVALAGIIIPIFAFDSATPFPALAAIPPVLGATILIWLGTGGQGSAVNSLLSSRVMVWVGLISYSLYLWHWPVLAYTRILSSAVDIPLTTGLLAVGFSLVMAWVSFRFVERPFRLHPAKGFGRRSIFGYSALALTLMLAVSAVLAVSEGLPGRMPKKVVALAAYAEDKNDRRADCFNRAPSDGLCSIGVISSSDNSIDFLFWGDSHADAMMPGMDSAARAASKSGIFAGSSGCPPIMGVQRAAMGERCTSFNNSVLTWLKARADVPMVILGARWTLSVEGTRYRGEGGGEVNLEWNGNYSPAPRSLENAILVEVGLHETVKEIVATGRQVILLGPIPEIGQDVPRTLARKAMFSWLPEASVTSDEYWARAKRTEHILMRVANDLEGVKYLPLSDIFCDSDHCRITSEEGVPFYVDDDHINKTASLNLLPKRLIEIWQ